MADRQSLGQQYVGIPQAQFFEEFTKSADNIWGQGSPEACEKAHDIVSYYMQHMLFSHLLNLIDQALSDDALESLLPAEVKFINIILVRDFMRQNAECIWDNETLEWIDQICDPLIEPLDIAPARKAAFPNAFDCDDIMGQWARDLAAPFSLQAIKFAVCHSAIVKGPQDEGLCT